MKLSRPQNFCSFTRRIRLFWLFPRQIDARGTVMGPGCAKEEWMSLIQQNIPSVSRPILWPAFMERAFRTTPVFGLIVYRRDPVKSE